MIITLAMSVSQLFYNESKISISSKSWFYIAPITVSQDSQNLYLTIDPCLYKSKCVV